MKGLNLKRRDRVLAISVALAVLVHLFLLGIIPVPSAPPQIPVLEVDMVPLPEAQEPLKPSVAQRQSSRSSTPDAPRVQSAPVIVPPADTGIPDNALPPIASSASPSAPPVNEEASKAEAPTVPVERPKTPAELRFAALPPQGEIDYQVSLGSMDIQVAKGTLRWKIAEGRYRIDLEARTIGIARLLKSNPVVQTSEGRISPQGLIPDEYHVIGRASETDEAVAQFNWANQTLTLQPAGTVFPLTEGTQDLLSFFFQFSIVPPETEGTSRAITNGRKLDRYAYELTEKTHLKLPLGDTEALHVSRLTGLNEDSFDIWLGEKYHLLPVQIRFFARGRVLTLYAKQIRIAASGQDSF